ncbi:MAG TPA: hypothetical protein VFH85_02055 [Gammaproteobacteria bacterium]|nr:hypothetical protein [Gammaproteobacteria bacterium]
MKYILAGLALITVSASGAAYAANPLSYSYLRVGYTTQDSDYFNDKAKGYGLEASWQFGENIYLVGSANHLDFDDLPGEEHIYSVGIGYEENPHGNTSAYLQARAFRETADFGPSALGEKTDRWVRLSWGFRTLVKKSSPWEIDGGVFYDAKENFGDRGFGGWVGIGAVWSHLGFQVAASHSASRDTVRVNLSWFF